MMSNKLQQLFPMIKTRQQVLAEIYSDDKLLRMYHSWTEKRRKEFLDFTTGAKGCKILYDSFFKEILNPETHSERLNALLTLILGKKVQILQMLPPDNSRLGNEESLVVMDIVVKLDDGSIIDVEIQKNGYKFPGQRSACYSSDLMLRQYKALKEQTTAQPFSYRDVRRVYTIVFFENSPSEFKANPDLYLHHFRQCSDTGIEVEHLQYFSYICLDNFLEILHNKGIQSDLDAWLTFLGSDEPEDILAVINYNPAFREMYEQIYTICQNIEGVMNMFSEELKIMDNNTARLMIDEMQNDIDELQQTVNEQQVQLSLKDNALIEKDNTIAEKDTALAEQRALIEKLRAELSAKTSAPTNEK